MSLYSRLQMNSSHNPWLGHRMSGIVRLLGILLAIAILGSLGGAVTKETDIPAVVAGWMSGNSGSLPSIYRWVYFLLKILRFFLSRVVNLNVGDMLGLTRWVYSSLAFFHFSHRYYLLVTIAFGSVYYVAARYIKNLHGLEHVRLAFRYLNALVFGLAYPRLEIDDGKKLLTTGRINLIDKIGGPGYLVIQPGNLVVLECVQKGPRVCAEGLNFVTRFERIREIINLDDQQNFIENLEYATKDGIPIRVRDVHYVYRLRTGRHSIEAERQDVDRPYSFSHEAALNRVYARSVNVAGITPWEYMVRIVVDGTITDYIRERNFNDVALPRFAGHEERIEKTREEIAKRLSSPGIRNRLRGLGAELIWVDIGHFEIADKRIEEQLVEVWGSKWVGGANVRRAYGDARRASLLEIGRAEAEAGIIMSILEAIGDLDEDTSHERIRTIILTRTAQLLDGMSGSDLSMWRGMQPPRELPPPRG
jgi:hypothetical protein